MNQERIRAVPTLALAFASVGFGLDGPIGIVAGGAVVLGGVLAWPLPFALGQVAAAAVFTDPVLTLPFALVQAGLWIGLGLSVAPRRQEIDWRAFLVSGVGALALLAPTWAWHETRPAIVTGVVLGAALVVPYAIHRYELVAAGLVDR